MYSIVYIPTGKIEFTEEVFTPLPEDEFKELVESIRQSGILQPLLLYHHPEKEDNYLLFAGFNRFRAALELGLSEVPCIVAEKLDDAANIKFDTDLFRRSLSKTEKENYKNKKLEHKEKLFREMVLARLIPELVSLYEKGELITDVAVACARLPLNEQKKLFESLSTVVSSGGGADVRAQLESLRRSLEEKEAEIRQMKKREDDLKDKVRAKLQELDRAKNTSDAMARKHYEKELEEMGKNLRELSLVIRERDKEIALIKEQKESIERQLGAKEAAINAMRIKMKEHTELCRSFLQKYGNPSAVLQRLDTVLAEIEMLGGLALQVDWDFASLENLKEKVKKITEAARRLEKSCKDTISELEVAVQ